MWHIPVIKSVLTASVSILSVGTDVDDGSVKIVAVDEFPPVSDKQH